MMESYLLPVRLTFAGIWLGCILTEVLFERALLGMGREQELVLVDLHKRVDKFVEIPAFVAVLATGILPFTSAAGGIMLMAKAGFGLLAVVANLYCVWLVFHRADAAHAGEWQNFARLDHLQHKSGAVVLLAVVATLGTGLYL